MPRRDRTQSDVDEQEQDRPTAVPAPGLLDGSAGMLRLMSAELGQELAHTLKFLRYLTGTLEERLIVGKSAEEARGVTAREIERVELLLGHLGRFRLPSPSVAAVNLRAIVERSVEPLGADVARNSVVFKSEVAPNLKVLADAESLATALQQLLQHAATNSSAEGHVAIYATPLRVGADARVQIDILDDGPPLAESSPAALFDVWSMACGEQQPCRRAIAYRLIRSLDGTLVYRHIESRNVFRITLPDVSRAAS